MKILFFFLTFIMIGHLAFGDAVIFSGNDVKSLKYNLDLFGRSKLMGLNVDPRAGAGIAAPLGSIGSDYLTGAVYIKTTAPDTGWVTMAGSATGLPLTFAGYDATGNLGSLLPWSYTDSALSYEGALINKTLTATITTLSGVNFQSDLDNGQTGVNVNGFQVRTAIGQTVATDASNYTPFASYAQVGANGTLGQYNAFYDGVTAATGSSVADIISFSSGPNIDVVAMGQYHGLRTTAQIGINSATHFTNHTGVGIYGNVGAFGDVDTYQGLTVSTNFSTGAGLDNFVGSFVGPNIDVVAVNSFTGFQTTPQMGQNSATGLTTHNEFVANSAYYSGATVDYYSVLGASPTFHTGSDVNNINMINLNPLIDVVAMNSLYIFNTSTNLGTNSATTLNSYVDANFNPNFGANLSLGDYSGIKVRPNVTAGAVITGNVQLMDMGINSAIPVTGYVKGYSVDLANFTSTQQKVGVQVNNSSLEVSSPVSTADAWFGSATSNNSIGGVFTVAAGSPVTGGAYNFGANLATNFIAEDNYPADATTFGLGFGVVGYVGQASVLATKTVANLNMAVAGFGVPATSTGGTITDVAMYKALGALPSGGTLNITNMYGFYAGPALSLISPTNVWGISIEDPAAENYFNKSLAIDTGTKKVSAAGVGLEIGNAKTAIVAGDIKTKTSFTMEDPGVGTNTITLQAPVLAANYTYTLPANYGNNGEAFRTNGAGVISWSTGIELGTVDPFARTQIWNKNTNASLRLGSLGQDGDATDVSSEGSVFYGQNAQGDAMSSATGDFGYSRIKAMRFGLYNSKTNVAGYIYRVDPTSMYFTDDAYVKTFEVTRATGITRIAGEVAINGMTAPTTSAALDVQGTDGAILYPRMTTAQRNALTATAGMSIYNTDNTAFECYTTSWIPCGSAMQTFSDTTLTAADSLAISTVVGFQQWRVSGNAAAIAMSTTPFGGTAPLDGTQITVIGTDDTKTVEFDYADIAKGYVGPDVVLGIYDSITVQYNSSLDRYVLVGTSL